MHYHFSVRIGSFQVIAICRYFLKKEIAGFQFFLNSGHKCPFLKKCALFAEKTQMFALLNFVEIIADDAAMQTYIL